MSSNQIAVKTRILKNGMAETRTAVRISAMEIPMLYRTRPTGTGK
jgi:hypothetical protein